MKAKLIDKTGKVKKEIELPKNFSAKVRSDIVLKVFEAQKMKQRMGAKIGAGAGYSASGILRHRRHRWKSTYGRGISRIPRKIFSRQGASFNWQGATVSSTRGGRRAHPPKAEENLFKKINKKELLTAVNSALSMGAEKAIVFDSGVLNLKTKDFIILLKKVFGDSKFLQKKSIRAGKGKLRGRKYKKNAGLLFVVGSDEKMNRKGIDVVPVYELMVGDLVSNGVNQRLVCYSEKAVKEIGEKLK